MQPLTFLGLPRLESLGGSRAGSNLDPGWPSPGMPESSTPLKWAAGTSGRLSVPCGVPCQTLNLHGHADIASHSGACGGQQGMRLRAASLSRRPGVPASHFDSAESPGGPPALHPVRPQTQERRGDLSPRLSRSPPQPRISYRRRRRSSEPPRCTAGSRQLPRAETPA
jgi:hypothetical protein